MKKVMKKVTFKEKKRLKEMHDFPLPLPASLCSFLVRSYTGEYGYNKPVSIVPINDQENHQENDQENEKQSTQLTDTFLPDSSISPPVPDHVDHSLSADGLNEDGLGNEEQGKEEDRYFHGNGTAEFLDGAVYNGTFEYGYMHGAGVLIWPDKTKYEGQLEWGKITGVNMSNN